jgi:hypothetical protein
MNVLRSFEAAVSLLADSGMDPLAAASIAELRDAIVAKSQSITIHTPPEQILTLVNLVEDMETLLDRLSAEHQVIESLNTGVTDPVAA